MTQALEFHEVANYFPLMEGKSYEKLKEDIAEHGLLSEGVIYEGKLLDGRNRYRACQELGVPFSTQPWKGQTWRRMARQNLCKILHRLNRA